MPDRAVLFIDGSNWFHALGETGVEHRIDLDYAAISEKLVQARDWMGTRYYLGPMKQEWDREGYTMQQKFIRYFQQDDPRTSFHPGRLEKRPQENELATELQDFLRQKTSEVSKDAFRALREMAEEHSTLYVPKEKEVDVKLAIDMYRMAVEDEYDAAYLLSADGDYVPAVEAVSDLGCDVFVASPNDCMALYRVAKTYISLSRDWFDDCYRGLDPGKYELRHPRTI